MTLVVMLGVYLPLFGGSLLLVLLAEKLVFSRIEPLRQWLGLYPRVRGTP